MSWLRLELTATADRVDALEDMLWSSGALSISIVSDSDERVLEPAPGQTPLWTSVGLHALYDLDTDWTALQRQLADLGMVAEVSFVGSDDWTEVAKRFAIDEVFGERLRVCAPGSDLSSDHTHLFLEPGLAFGSGGHPTTALCLEWLAQNIQGGERVLDFGCGSGILAIGACLLGAEAVCVDHDPQALVATEENAQRNGISASRLSIMLPEDFAADSPFDVVVANILAQPLIDLAPTFEQAARIGGAVVLSGLLNEQGDAVMAAYNGVSFEPPRSKEEWICLAGRRQR